jgi:hypothetical protein
MFKNSVAVLPLSVIIIVQGSWCTLGAYRGHKHYMSLPMTKKNNYSPFKDIAWSFTGLIAYGGIITTPFAIAKELNRLNSKDQNNYEYNELF